MVLLELLVQGPRGAHLERHGAGDSARVCLCLLRQQMNTGGRHVATHIRTFGIPSSETGTSAERHTRANYVAEVHSYSMLARKNKTFQQGREL